MIKVSKLKLYVATEDANERNRVYSYIRELQYLQYKMLNSISGALYSNFYNCGMDLKAKEFLEVKKKLTFANTA